MANSMTGFGRCEAQDESGKLSVEIRSVNHRYLDLNLKINHRLLVFENLIRRMIRDNLSRGKVDVSISFHPTSAAATNILYNEALANMYTDRISKIAKDFDLVNDLTAIRLANMRDVLTIEENKLDEDELLPFVESTVKSAIDSILEHRRMEGENLKEDLLNKLSELSEYVVKIEASLPEIVDSYKKRLTERVEGLIVDKEIEAQRIAMEVVMFADKIAIDEEIVRLKSHIDTFKDTLNKSGEIGRKLDFITQEMNREANTILSKTQDPDISDMGINIKTLIEKIREQVQNIE